MRRSGVRVPSQALVARDASADVRAPARAGAPAVRPLRHEVLRPGAPAGEVVFPGDDHPLAAHVAASDSAGNVVAVGSIYPEPPPWDAGAVGAWRIRGMATKKAFRSRGLGSHVLGALVDHAAANGGHLVWCHARRGAWSFYRRAGFVARGEPFDDGFAEHRSMWRRLGAGVAASVP